MHNVPCCWVFHLPSETSGGYARVAECHLATQISECRWRGFPDTHAFVSDWGDGGWQASVFDTQEGGGKSISNVNGVQVVCLPKVLNLDHCVFKHQGVCGLTSTKGILVCLFLLKLLFFFFGAGSPLRRHTDQQSRVPDDSWIQVFHKTSL